MKNPSIIFISVPNDHKYIRIITNAIKFVGIESYIYNNETINDVSMMSFYIFLQHHDVSVIFNHMDNIINDVFTEFDLDRDLINIDILDDATKFKFGYKWKGEEHIISKFKDIVVSDVDSVGYKYPVITQHLNTFNTYESIKNNLLILSMINNQKYKNVLFIGKDYSLYDQIAKDNYSFEFDSCDIDEMDRFNNREYNCVFINGYLNGDYVLDIATAFKKSRCIVISGILVPEFEKQYYSIINEICSDGSYKSISSHYWKSYIIGDLDIAEYDHI